MLTSDPSPSRQLKTEALTCELAVIGGGLAGVCCAITAARAGMRVVLVQDRPVLGGNASSEVRLWVLGATSHMGNNNRWSREGGVIDEILIENLYRNPEGNALILDSIVLEKVVEEPNITLLLNTAAFEVGKSDPDTISFVRAFCSQNSTLYGIHAPLYCDASGDGIIGFLSGAAFRMGAESRDEFGEKFAPSKEYGELLGHTLYFFSKDTGRPVQFIPPSFALKDITAVPRWRNFTPKEYGCKLWWIEYGGRLDTVHDTEKIKWELWKVVYGVWDHIKNSGQFPEAANLTLEWVGTIPGKRESRRFEGDYMLTQQDLIEQRGHADAVSFGGWAIDLHPADGVFSEKPGCSQWHSKGVYQIPYRCLFSRNITNLFLAGRVTSSSHVAFGSTRVMATCAHSAQAVGMAAALCKKLHLKPRDLAAPGRIEQLQLALLRLGQHIPHVDPADRADLAASATITASSQLRLKELPAGAATASLAHARAMLIPVQTGLMPKLTFSVRSTVSTMLQAELRTSSRPGNFTPDVTLVQKTIPLDASGQMHDVIVDFGVDIEDDRYVMVCLLANPHVEVALSEMRLTGVLSLVHKGDDRVADSAIQTPPGDIGVDRFEFWLPQRRPGGQNLAMKMQPALSAWAPQSIQQGPDRPVTKPNAWAAEPADPSPWIELAWPSPRTISRIELCFDTDFDHAVESVLMGHPERVMPFCVAQFCLRDAAGAVLAQVNDNHQTRRVIGLTSPVTTHRLRLELHPSHPNVPAALFRVRCFA